MDDANADMKLKPANPKITSKLIAERKTDIMRMYHDVLRIGDFKVFKPFELIISDILDLNTACVKGKAKAQRDGKPNACLAISSISYGGDNLFFLRFWYTYHSDREGLTASRIEKFFNEKAKGFEKKTFKKNKSEETYSYVKLLKVISFDLRQNVVFS